MNVLTVSLHCDGRDVFLSFPEFICQIARKSGIMREKEGKSEMILAPCNCSNEFQDQRYGKGIRGHNPCKGPGDTDAMRCMVCGIVRPIPVRKTKAVEQPRTEIPQQAKGQTPKRAANK